MREPSRFILAKPAEPQPMWALKTATFDINLSELKMKKIEK